MNKIKCEVTIPTGPYANIKPVIELDLDNLEEARALVGELYLTFGNMLENLNGESLKEVNYKLQKLTENARNGVASDIEEYQEIIEKAPGAGHKINEAKKAYNRREYAERKAAKQAEAELDHALDLQHDMDSEAVK